MMKRVFIFFVFFFSVLSFAEEIPFRLIFTGDLHSSFEVRSNAQNLGGMARLKTAMDQLRTEAEDKKVPVLQLDAGDCSEGSIYFNLGAGVASFEMLNRMGYDAVVVGNHDWYTGPQVLDKVLARVTPNFSFLSANLNFSALPEDNKLSEKIKPKEIFYLVDGKFLKKGQDGFIPEEGKAYFKVGVMGLSTNEGAYQFFFSPVTLKPLLPEARRVALDLRRREKVDVVILLSHLLDENDLEIANADRMPIDLIIGGHSHNKYVPDKEGRPVVIESGEPKGSHVTWLAKTGEFAKFMGKMDLLYDTSQGKMMWNHSHYELQQIDSRYPQNEDIKKAVQEYRAQIQHKYSEKNQYGKDIFDDEVAVSDVDLVKSELSESYLGNLVVSAIFDRVKDQGVDFAFNNSEFFSHGIKRGIIHSVDIYNMLPLIYDPLSDQSWTIWTFEVDGAILKKIIDFVFTFGKSFDVANLEVVYNPDVSSKQLISMRTSGQELLDDKRYKVAASQGIIEALKQIQSEEYPIYNPTNTHIELWSVLREYMSHHSPLKADDADFKVQGRVRTIQPDLSILPENVHLYQSDSKVQLSVSIQNIGYGDQSEGERDAALTDPTWLYFYYDRTPDDAVDDIWSLKSMGHDLLEQIGKWFPVLDSRPLPSQLELIDKISVPSLRRDDRAELNVTWDISMLQNKGTLPYVLYVDIEETKGKGFISIPDENNPGALVRKLMTLQEKNLDNNRVRTYVGPF